MTKPIMYVELDGPVLVPGEHDNMRLGMSVAPYAKPFMHWANHNFDVRWLTERPPSDAFHAALLLGLPSDAIKYMAHGDHKAQFINPRSDFWWVDSILTPGEMRWVHENNHERRVITVDPFVGVTPSIKEHLEKHALRGR